ncbi:MAG: hypothetical protein ACRC35_10655, partial [Angustibacter sp.]
MTIFLNQARMVDARRYRDLLVARGPLKLAELARWLTADGHDLAGFDGSSASLGRLWEWFIDYTDRRCPGTPETALPLYAIGGPPPVGPPDPYQRSWSRRVAYVGEAVVEYFMAMIARVDPGAGWQVYLDCPRNDSDRKQPMLQFSDGTWSLHNPVQGWVLRPHREDGDPERPWLTTQYRDSQALLTQLLTIHTTSKLALINGQWAAVPNPKRTYTHIPQHLVPTLNQPGPPLLANLPTPPTTPL